ncbi:MAG: hypothetical protein H0U95_12855 [Bacteroidetes bacterium]|nr:hypothetical protein [Bacteroidota bacterium]
MQTQDSTDYSLEVFAANFNNWTGDNYGYYPSLQIISTWYNKNNTTFGAFGCFNFTGSDLLGSGLYSNGVDVFFSKAFSKKLLFIFDAYTYINKRDTLTDYFGYNSSIYNLFSTRLRYDFNKYFDVIGGYSIMNNADSLLQSVSIELDFNITDRIILMASYSSGANVLDFNQGYFNSGLGVILNIKKIDISIMYNPWLNPLPPSAYGIKFYSPVLLSISTDLAKHFKKNKIKKEIK